MRRSLSVLTAVILAAACSSDPSGPEPTDPLAISYAPALNVDFTRMTQSATGLWFEDVVLGDGDLPEVGAAVDVLYAGYLSDGTLFDQVDDPEDPFRFFLGVTNLIPGFTEGVSGMRPGGKRKLVIPPQLGYGFQPFGPIPANSVIVFDVELLAIDAAAPPEAPRVAVR